MRLEWLEDFIALAKIRSFSSAAQHRYVTHPAFGRRIKALEEWVGTPLVIRTQPIELTQAGMVFLEAALQVVERLNSVKVQLNDSYQPSEYTLRITTGRALASLFFPRWYKTIVDELGFFHAHISTSGAEGSIYKLISKESDLLIAYNTPLTDLLMDEQLFDSIVVGIERVLPVSAVRANGRPLYDFDDRLNASIPWLSFSQALSLRAVLVQHLQKLDYLRFFKSVFEADTYDTILEMVKQGIGVAWLPYSVIKNDLKNQSIQVIGHKALQMQTEILLYKHKDMHHPYLEKIWLRKKAN